MLVYLLLFFIILLWILSFCYFKDFFSPSSFLCLSYIFALICALYNLEKWNLILNLKCFWIILIGLALFVFSSIFFSLFINKKKKSKNLSYIDLSTKKVFILTVISLIIMLLYSYYFFVAIGGVSALGDFENAMTRFRSKTMIHGIQLIPSYINFLIKFCRALAYIYTYVLVNNLFFMKKIRNIKNFKLYLFGIIIYLPLVLMSGGRYDFIVYFIFVLVLWVTLYKIKYSKSINLKRTIKIFALIVIVLISFSSFRSFFGRYDQDSTLDYITEYFGGSIYIFNNYLYDDYVPSPYFGNETFSGIRKLLIQFKILSPVVGDSGYDYVILKNGEVLGNVYTGFRKYYSDFNILGILIFMPLLSLIFTKFYYSSALIKNEDKFSLKLIIYASICFCLVLHSFSEAFFSNVLSFNYITLFIIMYLIYIFFYKVTFKGDIDL